jgi:hypothetical protein
MEAQRSKDFDLRGGRAVLNLTGLNQIDLQLPV